MVRVCVQRQSLARWERFIFDSFVAISEVRTQHLFSWSHLSRTSHYVRDCSHTQKRHQLLLTETTTYQRPRLVRSALRPHGSSTQVYLRALLDLVPELNASRSPSKCPLCVFRAPAAGVVTLIQCAFAGTTADCGHNLSGLLLSMILYAANWQRTLEARPHAAQNDDDRGHVSRCFATNVQQMSTSANRCLDD